MRSRPATRTASERGRPSPRLARLTAAAGVAIACGVLALAVSAGCHPSRERSPRTGQVLRGVVTYVVDGDTIHVRLPDGREEKVRLIGIDAPEDTELRDPYGPEATAFARRELQDRQVWLQTDAELRDRYGRLLAYVWLTSPPGTPTPQELRSSMFDARMLAEGYATLLTVPPNVRYADAFAPLQDEAREERRGLWGMPPD